jgi:hypothetical protein
MGQNSWTVCEDGKKKGKARQFLPRFVWRGEGRCQLPYTFPLICVLWCTIYLYSAQVSLFSELSLFSYLCLKLSQRLLHFVPSLIVQYTLHNTHISGGFFVVLWLPNILLLSVQTLCRINSCFCFVV